MQFKDNTTGVSLSSLNTDDINIMFSKVISITPSTKLHSLVCRKVCVCCKSVLHTVSPLLCITINYTGIIYTMFTVGLVRSQKKRISIVSFITGAVDGLNLLLLNAFHNFIMAISFFYKL